MEEIWTCPNCGASMKKMTGEIGLYHICPKCGCTLEGQAQRFEANQSCPNCHREIDGNSECSYCGYDLGTDFQ